MRLTWDFERIPERKMNNIFDEKKEKLIRTSFANILSISRTDSGLGDLRMYGGGDIRAPIIGEAGGGDCDRRSTGSLLVETGRGL